MIFDCNDADFLHNDLSLWQVFVSAGVFRTYSHKTAVNSERKINTAVHMVTSILDIVPAFPLIIYKVK